MSRAERILAFSLGLLICAISTVHVSTGIYYLAMDDFGFIININVSRAVSGFAFFLTGLFLTYSGRNKPGSSTEALLP